MSAGKLFYVMGASGSGKDTLLDCVARQLQGQARIVQRFITRPADAGGETHNSVSQEEFLRMVKNGDFCMHWAAHDLYYGIHSQILQWISEGECLLLNGSRDYLATAREVVPDLVPVLLQVSPAVQEARLNRRGREAGAALSKRLLRKVRLDETDRSLHVINNDTSLEGSVAEFCTLISKLG